MIKTLASIAYAIIKFSFQKILTPSNEQYQLASTALQSTALRLQDLFLTMSQTQVE